MSKMSTHGLKKIDLFFAGGYNISVEKSRADTLTPAALAFIGDAVQALYIRKRLVAETDLVGGTLHGRCTRFVNAGAQAHVFDELTARGTFTAEETDIAHRAKNAHLHSRSKSATNADYHRATALEAVIGWLEITGSTARLEQILGLCYDITRADLT